MSLERDGVNKADYILMVFPWKTIESDSINSKDRKDYDLSNEGSSSRS